ncbi:transient receptor potential cation channel subfamily A member 1 homolog, partial [Ruditapes philippinarum]|uniref:transient receptor potential cation channel subfamily A member 1 homolog n=1 Tax=Ruditapes philippinarum TaxID=129788 RepID=UPI00295C0795
DKSIAGWDTVRNYDNNPAASDEVDGVKLTSNENKVLKRKKKKQSSKFFPEVGQDESHSSTPNSFSITGFNDDAYKNNEDNSNHSGSEESDENRDEDDSDSEDNELENYTDSEEDYTDSESIETETDSDENNTDAGSIHYYTDSDENYPYSENEENENDTDSYENYKECLIECLRLGKGGDDLKTFLEESEDGKNIGEDEDGNNVLHIAASGKNLDLFKDLFHYYKEKVNEGNKKKRTPLHIAARNNRHDIVDFLIKSGADVSFKDVKQLTPLLTAIRYDSLKVFQRLTKEDMPDGTETDKMLEIATKFNSKKVAKELIQTCRNSKDVIERNCYKLVSLATVNNSDKLLKMLLDQVKDVESSVVKGDTDDEELDADEDAETETQSNQIQESAGNEGAETETKTNQIQNTGDTSQEKKHKKEPLHVAAEKGYFECLNILIKKTSDLCTKCENGKTALHLAAAKGRIRNVECLIEKAPKLMYMKDKSKRTALHDAIKHVKVVEILLLKGAKINTKDKNGRTPLSYAAENGMLECTIKLVENGADINLEDNNKMGPIHFAAQKGQTEVFYKLASSKKIDLDKPAINCLDLAIDNNHVETVLRIFQLENSKWTKMLRSRSKLNDSDEFHDTPMRKLIRQMPEAARKVFNHCTKMSKASSKQFEVTFNYEFLDDTYKLGTWRKHIPPNQPATKKDDSKYSKDSETKQSTANQVDQKHSQDKESNQSTTKKDDSKHSKDSETKQITDNQVDPKDSQDKKTNQITTKRDDSKNSKDSETKHRTAKKVDPKHTKDSETNKSSKPYTENTNMIKENHPLMIMVTSKRKELLDHPLVSALLKRKWISVGLVLNILIVMLYALFLALLTGFTLDVPAPYQFQQGFSVCSDLTNESISVFASFAKYGIITLASIILLIEILEMKQMFSWNVWFYFLEVENVIEWITCITAIIFVVNSSGCSDSGYRPQWQWTCGTVSVFLAWINMLFIIQKFEWLGIYVVMLYRIIKVFMKFLLVFSLLIVAFALSFHCLFQNQEPFSTIWKSLMRTTSMMIGGPDFVSTFLDETVHFEIISNVFFVIFMLFMAIVVINLLVGLAVSNIHEFQQKADLAKKQMQVKFALELERMAKSTFLKNILECLCFKCKNNNESMEKLIPNELSWFKKKVGESWKLTERDIKAAMSSEKDDNSRVVARLDTKMKTLETNLEEHMKYMGTQLAAILDKIEKTPEETGSGGNNGDTSREVAGFDTKLKTLETHLEEHMQYSGKQFAAILDKMENNRKETDANRKINGDNSRVVAGLDTKFKILETKLEEHMQKMGAQLAAILDKTENNTEETDDIHAINE